jgi:predicted dehydrogenase
MDTINWGILGTGGIAHKFANGLKALDDARLLAVGSRNQETADTFGDEFGATNRHASYEDLAADPDVHAIYIATPHDLHCENAVLCLEAGKAVICEKPFSITVAETDRMIAAARRSGVFLMEAMWTRFLPALVELRKRVANGDIGEPRMLSADFGFRVDTPDPNGRLFNLKHGGGALLDVGVYPVSLASMVFGAPTRIASLANLGETGVDEEAGIVLGHDGGAMAVLYTAIRATTPQDAVLMGSGGSIRIHSPWWVPTALTVSAGGSETTVDLPFDGNGYNYEAAEVMACLRAGETESDVMPLSETRTVIQTLCDLRAQWGLRYPADG